MHASSSHQNCITTIAAVVIMVVVAIGVIECSDVALKNSSPAETANSRVEANTDTADEKVNSNASENVNANANASENANANANVSENANANANESATAHTNANANTAAATKVNFTDNVEELFQFPELLGGCEVAALVCNLRALGFDAGLTSTADDYLYYSPDGDFATGYSGDPYYAGFGFPACIVTTANAYLADQGTEGAKFTAHELDGVPFDDIMAQVDNGWPIIIWTTMYMEEPQFTGITSGGYEWYENEHCVVVYGRTDDGEVQVSDPIDGLVERDADTFASIYEECGSLAVIINYDK